MYIAELTYPGTWLDYVDAKWRWKVERLLHDLESPLADAAMALAFFEQESAAPRRGRLGPESEVDGQRRRALESEFRRELGMSEESWVHDEEVRHRADVAVKRERWSAGQVPGGYERRIIFMHSRSFLFALDRLDNLIRVLTEIPDVPQTVVEARAELLSSLPDLRGVRDSTAHFEDRSRGLAKGGKILESKPVLNQLVHATAGGIVILESLAGNRFGSTMSNGEFGQVEISEKSLSAAARTVQNILDAFKWKGPRQHHPS